MRGYKNSDARVSSLVDHLPELSSRNRVNTSCWFVEEYDTGLMKYRNGKSKLLFPSHRQRGNEFIRFSGEVQALQQFVGLIFYETVAFSVNACIKTNILPDRQIFIQREFLAHIPDIPFDLFVLRVHVK